VTDAIWSDVDNDGWKDLVIVGEWMPVTIYKNEKGRLKNITRELGLENTTGLWNTIFAADLNNDGYEDLLAGNRGENSKLKASADFPLQLYIGDVDKNGSIDQLLATANKGKYYSFLGKEELEKALPGIIRKKYLDYRSMAGKTVEDILGGHLPQLKTLSAKMLSSVLIKNNKGKFSVTILPPQVQWSPVFSFITGDFNKDGNTDILSAGNFFGVLPYEGRYDAGNGNVLLNNSAGFQNASLLNSGLILEGEIRDIKKLKTVKGKTLYVFARNNNSLIFVKN